MKLLHLLLAAAVSWTALYSNDARGAQDAQVVEDVVPVFDSPTDSGQEIDYLAKGTVVRISSGDRSGWYKVIIPGRHPTVFGWVSRKAVRPNTLTSQLDSAGIQRYSPPKPEVSRNLVVLAAGARGAYLAPRELQDLIGASGANALALGFGLEAGYRLSTQVTGGVRLVSHTLSQEQGEDRFALSMTGFGAFVEWTYNHNLPFKAGLSLGAGLLSASVSGSSGGTAFESEAGTSMLWFPAKFTFHWYPLENVALYLGLGYQYAASSAVFQISAGNSVEVNSSAPIAEAGLQVEF